MQKKIATYQSVLVICVGFLAIHLWTAHQWALWTAFALGLVAVLSPFLARKLVCCWDALARLLSFIMPNILLTLIYFVLLTPIALLARIVRSNPPISHQKPVRSNFQKVEKCFDANSLEHPW